MSSYEPCQAAQMSIDLFGDALEPCTDAALREVDGYLLCADCIEALQFFVRISRKVVRENREPG